MTASPNPLTFAGKRQQVTNIARTVQRDRLSLLWIGESQDKRLPNGTRTQEQSVRGRQTHGMKGLVLPQSPELVGLTVYLWPWGGYHLSLSGHWFPSLLCSGSPCCPWHWLWFPLANAGLVLWPLTAQLWPQQQTTPTVTSLHPGARGSAFRSCCQSA